MARRAVRSSAFSAGVSSWEGNNILDSSCTEVRGPAPFGAGVLLAWEEHEQKYDEPHCLLVAQPELQRKLNHGCFP